MASKRFKTITNEKEVNYFTSLAEEDITTTMIMETFGEFNGVSKYKPTDLIIIPKGSYTSDGKKNSNDFTTTLGQYIFNVYFIQKDLSHLFPYFDKTINSKEFNNINRVLSHAILEEEIELDKLKRYIMKCEKFMPYVAILSPNHTLKMLTVTKDINVMKNKLIKKYEKELKAGDEVIASKMQDELLDYARELLKDDPSMDMFDSGYRGSFTNNFKNMYVMKGAIKNPDPTKGYDIATSNYIDGISKEEYSMFANSLAEGPYFRAKKTELGGYWEKLFMSAFQHIVLDPAGSDCGTTRYIKFKITSSNVDSVMYSYIIEGSKLIELTSKNADKYIGKEVKLRYSSLCESKTGICNKCFGTLPYRLGIVNIGTATPQIPSKLKTTVMKAFHNSQVTLVEMDPMKAFGF